MHRHGEDGRVPVRVIRTDVESMIARVAAEFIPRAPADPSRAPEIFNFKFPTEPQTD
jgi:hypothetical protein